MDELVKNKDGTWSLIKEGVTEDLPLKSEGERAVSWVKEYLVEIQEQVDLCNEFLESMK